MRVCVNVGVLTACIYIVNQVKTDRQTVGIGQRKPTKPRYKSNQVYTQTDRERNCEGVQERQIEWEKQQGEKNSTRG